MPRLSLAWPLFQGCPRSRLWLWASFLQLEGKETCLLILPSFSFYSLGSKKKMAFLSVSTESPEEGRQGACRGPVPIPGPWPWDDTLAGSPMPAPVQNSSWLWTDSPESHGTAGAGMFPKGRGGEALLLGAEDRPLGRLGHPFSVNKGCWTLINYLGKVIVK